MHYVFPVQAKGGSDILSVVQIEQDYAMCATKFKKMICRPIGAQFISDDLISLFEFVQQDGEIRTSTERHYRLVPAEDVTAADLENYKKNSI
ncbi:MAG: hypothetical protein M1379_16740 [Firmicutes bacterium]|nr:hypothetical protein [Bacillota bacterium]